LEHEHENIHIINGCKNGNRKAQESLYKNYYRAMIAVCLRYTRNDNDAVEVLNNGFLKVFNNIQRYDPAQASLYTWIRTVVINSCLDFIKQKQRIETAKELQEENEVHIEPEVITRMKAQELLQLIRKLPPATQTVFNLYVIEGYNHQEIGKLLNISEGTSKWHLSEARKSLQLLLKKQEINS
jgi:RNA polymerase sigma factor (sigma-70 family)